MTCTKNDHRDLVRLVIAAWLVLCLAGFLSGCQAIAGLGADIRDAANTMEFASRQEPRQ